MAAFLRKRRFSANLLQNLLVLSSLVAKQLFTAKVALAFE
jgi:hypothetical protein